MCFAHALDVVQSLVSCCRPRHFGAFIGPNGHCGEPSISLFAHTCASPSCPLGFPLCILFIVFGGRGCCILLLSSERSDDTLGCLSLSLSLSFARCRVLFRQRLHMCPSVPHALAGGGEIVLSSPFIDLCRNFFTLTLQYKADQEELEQGGRKIDDESGVRVLEAVGLSVLVTWSLNSRHQHFPLFPCHQFPTGKRTDNRLGPPCVQPGSLYV